MARPQKRSSANDRALEYVRTQILTGEFPTGELITEGAVAEALKMSRTPVREAFLRLEAGGLLRLYPQRGALVVPVSPDEARAVIESRLLLERFAATTLLRRGPEARQDAVNRMESELSRQRRAAQDEDWSEFLDGDRAFHHATLEASGNPVLADFYAMLRDRQMRMIGASHLDSPTRVTTILQEHEELLEALRTEDAQRAERAVRTHLASTVRTIGITVDFLQDEHPTQS